jgi:hypothetical protein
VPDDQVEDLPDSATTDPDGVEREIDASMSQSLVPSSFGFTFCVDGEVETIEVEARWGRYERGESEKFFDEETMEMILPRMMKYVLRASSKGGKINLKFLSRRKED